MPNTNIIRENKGKKETNTSFNITDRGGISSAGGFGARDGFNQALTTTYNIYNPANINPGKIAAANNLNGES